MSRNGLNGRLEYHLADRLCRAVRPSAQDYLRRSLALARLGFSESAAMDIERAEAVGARDLPVLCWMLHHHPDVQKRDGAARSLLLLDQAGRAASDDAVNRLFSGGERVVHKATRNGARIQGWVAGLDRAQPSIHLQFGDGRKVTMPISFDSAVCGNGDGLRASFSLPADPSLPVVVTGRVGLVCSEPTTNYPEISASSVTEKSSDDPSILSVIIPIYGDANSLRACLEALSQQSPLEIKLIVIDDATPDLAVAELGRRFCADMNGFYHRSRVNGGFAASVNLGLSFCPRGDVLLLNSDVILPKGALERLRAAARSAPDIGTVSPLSNDSGETGFPDPLHANPLMEAADHVEIDQAAQAASPGQVIDLLAPLGSCLYVTQTALRQVGRLSLLYGRGYYEDVDFYLRVRQAGLRNVAACDVYVSHEGGRSFGSEKRALVARNHVVLKRRFPDFELDDVVFDFADPLRLARAAIEERLRPGLDRAVIVVGRAAGSDALFDERIKVWRARARPVLLMRWRGSEHRVEIDLEVREGPGPRSLRFAFMNDGIERILAYLKPLDGIEVEVLEPQDLPSAVVRLLNELDRPLAVLIESLASAATLVQEPDAPPQNWHSSVFPRRSAPSRVMGLDRMAAAWLETTAVSRSSRPPSLNRPRQQGGEISKLGVSFAVADAGAELFFCPWRASFAASRRRR